MFTYRVYYSAFGEWRITNRAEAVGAIKAKNTATDRQVCDGNIILVNHNTEKRFVRLPK